jgi:acyl-CoA synthetase (NDP forming)
VGASDKRGPSELRPLELDRFFHPRSVAVIGASDTPGRPITAMTTKVRQWAQAAGSTIYMVNPNRTEVDGIRCLKSVVEVPEEVDLAVILVGDAMAALEEVIEANARFAVIFAAGFAEVGASGEELQQRLADMVASGNTRLLGPNTNLNAFESFRDDLPRPSIALITQSGHQGRPIFQGQELGIALSHWAPTGNEVDLEVADFIGYFSDQDEVGVIAAYVEGFKDGRTLMLAADHAAKRGVPLVIVKVGRTKEGSSMAKAHTGHLTGSDAVTSAVMRQYGITRVEGLDELLDTSALFARAKAPKGDGVCIYAISGGTGAHMADMASAQGLRLPELTAATQRQLHEWIPEYLRVSNPVDNGGAPSSDWRGRKILDAIVADDNVDLIICPITGAVPAMSEGLATDLVGVSQTTDKPICVIWGSPVDDDRAYREILLGSQLPVFRTFGNCVRAVRAYFDYHSFKSRYRSEFDRRPARPAEGHALALARMSGGGALSEALSKEILSDYGISVSRDLMVTSVSEAVDAARSIGLPVVLKACSPDLHHKSDLGLVIVGVRTLADVRSAYRKIEERVAATSPDARIEGMIVSEMITDGVEVVVGTAVDELFGPTVMFGLGGIFLETFNDVTFRVPPFSDDEARRMISEVKAFRLLTGERGRPKADVVALVDLIMKVQQMAIDLSGDLLELDINPVAVRPGSKGAVALDALVVAR